MATEAQNPDGAAIHRPNDEDFQRLFTMNPLAAAQLEAIIWKRIALSKPQEKETSEQTPEV